jgi:hypothetical protein
LIEKWKPCHVTIGFFETTNIFRSAIMGSWNACKTWVLTHSQLLKGFKCESKWKTAEEEGVGARSLAHNTFKGRGACWSSGMGLGRIDKLHSLAHACTQPTQSG